ncbi:Auxilin-related protein 2 [Heracleum sosnowskyi]|uniref:Auxilin-related protein 2 n=1 Tax=Heracleum sosnowskyi TaxID=360622 RepID=A0AAD8J6F4_9APIA|nr:Auxilin-related protein 2 [Heracleum sosnowskyi]
MDDLGIFARDLGYKPSGKSAPMKSAGIGSDRSSPAPFSDDQFSDVFGGPPKYSSTNSNVNAASSMSGFDYDSIFKASKNEAKVETKSKWDSAPSDPVYDKPVYDDDIFDGLPGLKSKSDSSSSKFEENVFANIINSPKKFSSGDHFDELLGNLNRKEKAEPRNKNTSRTASDFDDLLPGFGSSSPSNRPIPESNQTSRPSANSNQTSKVMDDPFVVLESTHTPGVSFSSDPLEEIGKLSQTGKSKENKSSVSAGAFDGLDPLNDFRKSVPAHSSAMQNSVKDGSPSRVRSSMKRTQESAGNEAFGMPAFKAYTERSSQKKVPADEYRESHQNLFEMPAASTESQKPIGQRASSPSYGNVSIEESYSQADQSYRTEERTQSSDDVWLTVSEIPLFTQPTRAPPPSRPPPPIPRHTSKAEKAFSTSNARHRGNDFSPPNSAQYSQSRNPFRSAPKDPMVTSIDELEEFAMARNYHENVDINSGDNFGTNSAAAASAAAMKDAVDRAEAKLKNAKEVREREHAKAARSKESVQRERDEQDVLDEEIVENQERLNRERQQKEEEEREQRRLEKERTREIERERARQAVERATREARERAAAEAREKATADARLKSERAAVQRAQAEARSRAAADARERAERAAAEARERANAEAREKEAKEKAAAARAEAEARRRAERAAVDRVAAAARERAAAEARDRAAATAAARTSQQKNENDLESFFNMGSRPSSAPRPRASSSDPSLDPHSQNRGGADGTRRSSQSGVSSNMKKASSTTNIVDDLSSIFGAAPSSGDFHDVEGETEERRKARLERHQRTQERAAKAVAEKNQRDLQLQKDQEERHRIAETLDIEIKRWAAGKEGNLRALLSTLQYVLWPECGWQPVSLTDLIMGASVKKVYRKATLCIHPDKVQQKGANIQQKYIAEKVFDLLKEAWNKFNSEELF